jgi:muconolactone delta-isomerase
MKDVYLVHITLPDVFTPRFYDLLSRQKNLMNKLLEERIVLSYSLDMVRKNVWLFIQGDSQQEVHNLLRKLPIIDEVSMEIHELAFHDAAPVSLPDLIMN